jgi:DNA repair exonuclease SbcCD ATPase subunit
MKIKKIEWRNFSSYGNKTQTLLLEERNSLFQIVGENGAGKSSISQVITFGLYGKLEGKKLKDIPNRINGNAWVRITLEHQSTEVVIERGLDPSLFRIFLNGKEFDQAGVKSVQDYLTEDILGVPYYVFNNTISLSINDFKSFLKMAPADKRSILDKIFGFNVLNQMKEILKSELRKLKGDLDILSGKQSSMESSIQNTQKEIEKVLEAIQTQTQQQDEELEKSLQTFQDLKKIHDRKISEFRVIESEVNKKSNEITSLVFDHESKLRDFDRKLKLYDSQKCPTCTSDLSSDFHLEMKDTLISERTKVQDHLDGILIESKKLDVLKSEHSITRQSLAEKGAKINSKVESIQNELRKLKGENKNLQVEPLERIIESLSQERTTIIEDKFKKESHQSLMKTVDEILGDKGVKQMAIRTILPSLNSEITNLLRKINLPHQVMFDEEFNAMISHMGIEIPVQTLSTGEMKKVDFVVLIAILKLMKMKFNSINLLFLDELFSSVDPEGVHSILSILKSVAEELGLNIFVINHAPMPNEIFDYKIEIAKKNNFSGFILDKF